jgi:hypothetical protein
MSREDELEDDGPIPGMSSLREVEPPPSLVSAVMKRVAEPAPAPAWSWLLRTPALTPADDKPIPGMSSLRETTPPPSLVPAVMRQVAEPSRVTFWSWLRRPRRLELRLSPLGALASALAGASLLAVLVVGINGRERSRLVIEVPTAPETTTVVVRFTLAAQGARKVAVAGDFNGWDPAGVQMVNQDGNGTFAATIRLPPGSHEYMFVVDGEWVTDPAAAELRPDGFGRTNAVLRL